MDEMNLNLILDVTFQHCNGSW